MLKVKEVVRQFVLDCETRGLSPKSILLYQKQLEFFTEKIEEYGVTDLELVKVAHIRQFIQLLMNTKSMENNPRVPTQKTMLTPNTIRAYVRIIKQFFRWCVNEELLDASPSVRLSQPKIPTYVITTFTPEQIEQMLATCDLKTPMGFRNYVMLLVLLDTGMRVAELCTLTVEDVHERYVKVFGKGRKEREIGLHPEVSKLLWKYIHKYRKPIERTTETKVFIGYHGFPLTPDGARFILDTIKEKCGLENVRVSPHTFRHTFAKMYLERGGELFKLSREMGHSGVRVTENYLKDFNSTEARKDHTDFSPVLNINLHGNKDKKKQKKTE